MGNNRVLLETSFEKLRCDLERFIPRGVDETGFHTQPLDYFEIIGSQHGENREAGYHSSRVMIDLPEEEISLIEIRTLHACPTTENASRRVTKVFAVIDLNELRALE